MLTSRYDDALTFAHQLHATQLRNGSTVPYISHLLATSALVLENEGDENQAIAALLHDAVASQGGLPTYTKIKTRFGEDVANIVRDCTDCLTEQKSAWRARKEAFIQSLETRSPRSLLVSLADKTHDAESILFGYLDKGEDLWGGFNGGVAGTRWYYQALVAVFTARLPGRLADRLARAVNAFAPATTQDDWKTAIFPKLDVMEGRLPASFARK